MSEIINNLKKKYDPIDYNSKPNHSPTICLFMRWAYKVEKNWYGFDLEGAPYKWCEVLHEFLKWIEGKCPEFKILQIKLKLGGIRVYLSFPCNLTPAAKKEISEAIDKLESWLKDKSLIY